MEAAFLIENNRKTEIRIVMTTLYSGGLVFDGKGNLQENQGVLVDDQKISKVAPC